MPESKHESQARPARESLQEYGRGVAGGLLFSLPLLYTMEVWWTGFIVQPWVLVLYVLVTYILLLGYNRYGGMHPDVRFADVAIDSVEELGLGLLLSTLILFLIGQITPGMPLQEIIGKITVEAMTMAIGFSVGTAQLGVSERNTGRKARNERSGREHPHFGGQMVLAFCGAILFAANVAPTEEIVLIAIETSLWKLVGLAVLSMIVGALILYYSEFVDAHRRVRRDGVLTTIAGVTTTYVIALSAAAMMLWFFQRFDGVSFVTAVAQIVVLGFAANLGATAGRLLIQ